MGQLIIFLNPDYAIELVSDDNSKYNKSGIYIRKA